MSQIDERDRFDRGEFDACFLDKKPLIIRGAARSWPAINWNFESLGEVCGNHVITIESYDAGEETYWEQMNRHKRTLYFDDYLNELQQRPDPLWSLRENYEIFFSHPELKQDFRVEALFPEITKEWFYYLWCGPEGYVTGLHADDLENNILVQIRGEKIFKFYHPDDTEFLYLESDALCDGAYYSLADPFSLDLEKFPAMRNATEYTATVGPGDMIYIPGFWWHAVKSLSPVISVNVCYGDNQSKIHDEERRLKAQGRHGEACLQCARGRSAPQRPDLVNT